MDHLQEVVVVVVLEVHSVLVDSARDHCTGILVAREVQVDQVVQVVVDHPSLVDHSVRVVMAALEGQHLLERCHHVLDVVVVAGPHQVDLQLEEGCS